MKKLIALVAIISVFSIGFIQSYSIEDNPSFLTAILVAWIVYFLSVRYIFPSKHLAEISNQPISKPNQQKNNLDWLLLLRFIAALVVFAMHSGIVFQRDFSFGGSWWGFIAYSPAWWGMTLFFALSGYLMSKSFASSHYSLTKEGVSTYLRNRVVRIFPLTLSVAIFVVIWQSPIFLGDFQLWARLITATFNGSNSPSGLGAFWSLSTEFQYYLFVPVFLFLIGVLTIKKPLILLTIVALLVATIGIGIREFEWVRHGSNMAAWVPYVYEPMYSNLDAFGLGFVAALLRYRLPSALQSIIRFTWIPVLLFSYLGYSWFAYPLMAQGVTGNEHLFAVVLPLFTAVTLSFTVLGADVASENRNYKFNRGFRSLKFILYWAGALTFPVYLVHSSIMDSIQVAFPDSSQRGKILLAIGLTFGVSLLLNLTVEKSFSKYRKTPK